jgi:hypothetical protein
MTFKRTSLRLAMRLLILSPLVAGAQSPGELNSIQKVPSGVILVKGAWASASDATTPVPEGGEVTNIVYSNPYFRLTYPLSRDWVKKYDGPPPSDSGYYVLAQLEPRDTSNGTIRGSLIITAADLFFSPTKADSALQFVNFTRNHLQADYKVTRAPTQITLAGHSFVRFDYFSPVAGLHWYVLATQIRCHIVQFVFTSRDMKLLGQLLEGVASVKLSGEEVPVCIKDYASPENLVERVDPILTGRKFNPIPVRVIIDKEGRVKHTHILSAFPEQSKAIMDALQQWKFKPHLRNGQPVEVETGIMFGHSTENAPVPVPATASATMAH